MLYDHAHAMQVKLCKANTQGVIEEMREARRSWDGGVEKAEGGSVLLTEEARRAATTVTP